MRVGQMNEHFNMGSMRRRWWWWAIKGKVCPPPDIGRLFTWFAPRATGRWRAFFLIPNITKNLPEKHEAHPNLLPPENKKPKPICQRQIGAF